RGRACWAAPRPPPPGSSACSVPPPPSSSGCCRRTRAGRRGRRAGPASQAFRRWVSLERKKEEMADIQTIANDLSGLSVMQVAELVKVLEQKWGVSAAAAPVMMAAAGAPAAGGAAAAVEEKTEFAVHLLNAGDKKINVIK